MLRTDNILDTIRMFEEDNLDIRTITMGISLLDCIDSDGEKARERIYKKKLKRETKLIHSKKFFQKKRI